ncbi:MAG TPA: TetR/AcrR family transcriptional regulator, partial [Spirochaetia bacterium]|nr:TetR/AcrR family transcriptional regulator [Spirochaetia bacterium]
MARAWSDQECKHLQKRLLDEAQALFERLGLQKTTVDDIVRAVGISKGAFYRFYGSKEELFFDVLERVETQVRTDLSSFAWDRGVPSVANLRRFFTQVADLTARVPFFKALNGVERLHLETRLPPETVVRHQADDEQVVIRLFQSWAEAGKIRTV